MHLDRVIDFLNGARDLVAGRSSFEIVSKAYKLIRREGFDGLKRIFVDLDGISYRQWIKCYDTMSDDDRQRIRQHIETLAYQPLISILMPVYNPPADFLKKAIESVREQIYPHWELCIADDDSTQQHVRDILEDASGKDPRIRVTFRSKNGHISAATNTALEMAKGDFIALLDHDDELAEHALYHVIVALQHKARPGLALQRRGQDRQKRIALWSLFQAGS